MYDNVVLKTSPTHYFPMSSSTSYDLLHQYNNNVYTGVQVIGTPYSASTVVPKTGYTFPIITNSGSAAAALKVKKGDVYNFTAQYTQGNQMWLGVAYVAYNFEVNNYLKDFSINFWFNFNNQINGQTKITDTNQILIYNIVQGNGNATSNKSLLEIYFDYPTSTFRLKFPDSDSKNTEAYCYVDKLDQNFQITAIYTRGKIVLKVNNQVGNGTVTKNSYIFYSNPMPFPTSTPPANLTFNITGASLGDSSNPTYVQNYLVSSLAYYQRILSDADLDTLASFAYQDGFPISQSILGNNSYFDFREIGNFDEFTANSGLSIESGLTNKYGDYQKIYGTGFKIGDVDNLNITKYGLIPIKFNKPYYYKADNTAASALNSSSGMNFRGQGYMKFDDIEYFNFDSKASMTCTINGLNDLSYSIINNIWTLNCGDKYLLFRVQWSVFSPKTISYILDEYDSTTRNLIKNLFIKSFVSSGINTDNVAVSFSNNTLFMYSSLAGTASVSISNPYVISLSDSLWIGQNTSQPADNTIYIKNFGIVNKYITDYSSFDFTNPSTIMFRMTSSANPFLVSQLGTWTYAIPLAIYPTCTVVGTQFNWNKENSKISVSSDGGITYSKILPYQPITNLNLDSVLNNLKVKMELQTEYDYDGTFQSNFSQIEYLVYTNQTIHSNGNSVYINKSDTKTANYTLSSQNNMLSRHKNFGIKFTGDSASSASTKLPGSASIVNGASTAYQTIDFWYRPDGINTTYRTNLMTNPSFESGITGWNANQGSSIALNTSSALFGSNCLEITQSSTIYSGTVLYDIAVDPSTTYTFSYYVKTGSGTASINLGGVVFCKPNLSDISSPWIFTSNVNYASAQGWVRVSRTFTTYSDTKYVSLFICPIDNGVAGQKFLVDGVMLEKSSTLNTYFDGTHAGNLVTNPSFESGSAGWSSNDSATITSASYDSLFGLNSLEVTQVATFYSGVTISSNIPVSPLTTYTYSYYIKTAPGTASIALGNIVHDLNSAGTIINQYNQSNITYNASANWTRVINTFTTSATTASVKLFVCNSTYPASSSAVAGQKFLIDGVMLEQSSSANQYVDSSLISWTGTSGLSTSKLGNSYIIGNTSSSLPSPAIWLNSSGKLQSLGGTLYINGASVADNTYTASANELYHIVLPLSASSTSSLYINGGNGAIPSVSSCATYGHVTLWTDQLTPDLILKRYQSYYYSNTISITDSGSKKYFSNSNVDSFKISRLNY